MSKEVELVGRVGEQLAGAGSLLKLRAGDQGEAIVAQLHGRFYEAARRGRLWVASTAVAGVAPGTALSTTPPMAIWNPQNSNILVELLQVFLSYISGTLGAGSMVHAQVPTQGATAPGATELTPVPGQLGNVKGQARAFQGATLAAVPTIVRPSMTFGPALATTAAFPSITVDEPDGSVLIPPGVAWAFQGVATAGTTPLVLIGAVYQEIPLP